MTTFLWILFGVVVGVFLGVFWLALNLHKIFGGH